ncbi:RCC1 domain-containing protein [Bifidobacterium aemilianum]|uniref:RCC1 domain-containing protein n=1 Tax=Bifidobacterium aemilianum TaxID=2493120 RepID=UPI0013750D1E|nr:hypothetical protein [Bifidobacterium aemilianum]
MPAHAAAKQPIIFCLSPNNGSLHAGQEIALTQPLPETMPEGLAFTALSAGYRSSFATASNGQTYAWGYDGIDLGVGTAVEYPGPSRLATPQGVHFLSVSAGFTQTVALTAEGAVYMWGHIYSHSGPRSWLAESRPQKVDLPAGEPASKVVSGLNHALVLAADGSVYVWDSTTGAVAWEGAAREKIHLVRVKTPDGLRFVDISTRDGYSLALSAEGSIYLWGAPVESDEYGYGSHPHRNTPVELKVTPQVRFVSIGAGSGFLAALGEDGGLYIWKIGKGQWLSGSSPSVETGYTRLEAPAGARFTALSVGDDHLLAMASDGGLYGWGDNPDGRLGTGKADSDSKWKTGLQAVAVPAGARFTSVSAGENHSLALTAEGKLYGWGSNDGHQLGDGSGDNVLVPTPIPLPPSGGDSEDEDESRPMDAASVKITSVRFDGRLGTDLHLDQDSGVWLVTTPKMRAGSSLMPDPEGGALPVDVDWEYKGQPQKTKRFTFSYHIEDPSENNDFAPLLFLAVALTVGLLLLLLKAIRWCRSRISRPQP